MIYLGNGIYSDSGPDTLSHYGVLGMKWGIHRAKIHEKNIYRNNIMNGMKRKNAKKRYEEGVAAAKARAKKYKGKQYNKKISFISRPSFDKANARIHDYRNQLAIQDINRGIQAGLDGLALGTLAAGIYNNAKPSARNTAKIARGQWKVSDGIYSGPAGQAAAKQAMKSNARKTLGLLDDAGLYGLMALANRGADSSLNYVNMSVRKTPKKKKKK